MNQYDEDENDHALIDVFENSHIAESRCPQKSIIFTMLACFGTGLALIIVVLSNYFNIFG